MPFILAFSVEEFALFVLFPVAALILVIAAPVAAILIKRKGTRRLERLIQDAYAAAQGNKSPTVWLRFHTYHGFVVFAVQTRHELVLPYPQARRLLEQFHRFNLTWGFFAYGALIIPLLSSLDYLSELRRLKQQAAESGIETGEGSKRGRG